MTELVFFMKKSYDDTSMRSLVVRDMALVKHAQYDVEVRNHPFTTRVWEIMLGSGLHVFALMVFFIRLDRFVCV